MDTHVEARGFAKAFAESLAASFTRELGAKWKLKVLESPDLAKRQGAPVHYKLSIDGKLQGDCFVEFYEPQITELGSKLLGQTGTVFTEEHGEALRKLIETATEAFGVALLAEHGALTFKVERVEDLAFGGMFLVPFSASGEGQAAMPALLYFDSKLLASLAPPKEPAAPIMEAVEAVSSKIDVGNLNLKLVMDVELSVSLRFGQRQLPLREVLELASGSVIELDRLVDDPVELLLDGKVIARGEAVIVDGNYGLRVTEVPHPLDAQFIR